MAIAFSQNGVPVRLTEERWQHIKRRHPEVESQQERVIQTLSEPDEIQQGDLGELLAIRFYSQTPLTSKHLVVVYREIASEDGFVLTAYFASRPSSRRNVLWRR